MIERFRFLVEEIFSRILTIAVKMLSRLKRIVLFIGGLKIRELMRMCK